MSSSNKYNYFVQVLSSSKSLWDFPCTRGSLTLIINTSCIVQIFLVLSLSKNEAYKRFPLTYEKLLKFFFVSLWIVKSSSRKEHYVYHLLLGNNDEQRKLWESMCNIIYMYWVVVKMVYLFEQKQLIYYHKKSRKRGSNFQ